MTIKPWHVQIYKTNGHLPLPRQWSAVDAVYDMPHAHDARQFALGYNYSSALSIHAVITHGPHLPEITEWSVLDDDP